MIPSLIDSRNIISNSRTLINSGKVSKKELGVVEI